MKNGTIVEKGSHEELLEAGGEYASLYNVQAKAFAPPSMSGDGDTEPDHLEHVGSSASEIGSSIGVGSGNTSAVHDGDVDGDHDWGTETSWEKRT